uniref:Uncharacterized protein n=1 Tax=Hyaloperonospora arabidopsidis (strain Emoy2) TaxID=559515 RepID=M4BVA3_HYAAE
MITFHSVAGTVVHAALLHGRSSRDRLLSVQLLLNRTQRYLGGRRRGRRRLGFANQAATLGRKDKSDEWVEVLGGLVFCTSRYQWVQRPTR